MRSYPNLDYEIELWKNDYIVIGVDEAGRGALAGPIFAAAIAFNPQQRNNKFQITRYKQITNIKLQNITHKNVRIDDSKKLTVNQRERAYIWLINNCLGYFQASIDAKYINKNGIGKANKKVMRDAVIGLIAKLKTHKNIFLLTDYLPIKYIKNITKKQQINLIHGDQISLSIAAASIIAKVHRDSHMRAISSLYPKYFWYYNKGYGTKKHLSAIKKYGICNHHRIKFCHI